MKSLYTLNLTIYINMFGIHGHEYEPEDLAYIIVSVVSRNCQNIT